MIHLIRESYSPGERKIFPHVIYGVVASSLIATLHIVTTRLGRYAGDADTGFTPCQHIAVHFCMVFYVLTELQFYYAYGKFEEFDPCTDCLKGLLSANIDFFFPYRREPYGYMMQMPDIWERYLDGYNRPKTLWACVFSYSDIFFFVSHIFFFVVGGLANYPIKRMVNPDTEYDFDHAMMHIGILFDGLLTPFWALLLGIQLLRVVRQANYVVFWMVVEWCPDGVETMDC